MGFVGYLIAVHAQMGNGSSGNQVQHAVEHAKACTQNGNNHRLDAPDGFTFTRGNRRFHLDRARCQVLGGCVAFQKSNLAHGLAEKIIGRIFIADHRQLMLNKRMIDNGQALFACEVHAFLLTAVRFFAEQCIAFG